MATTEPLGRHHLIELHGCDPARLDDLALVRLALLDAAEALGAEVVGEAFHRFAPQGVTGLLAISESHLAIHTWPEHAYAAADVFACGGASERMRPAFDVLFDRLGAGLANIHDLERGFPNRPPGR